MGNLDQCVTEWYNNITGPQGHLTETKSQMQLWCLLICIYTIIILHIDSYFCHCETFPLQENLILKSYINNDLYSEFSVSLL